MFTCMLLSVYIILRTQRRVIYMWNMTMRKNLPILTQEKHGEKFYEISIKLKMIQFSNVILQICVLGVTLKKFVEFK